MAQAHAHRQAQWELREPVVFENEGQKIFGTLHRPLPLRRTPAILMCHGFGGNKVGRYRIYVSIAEYLARRGIASLRIDFRGSGDSEGDFAAMTVDTEVSDALKGLHFLRNHPSIDPAQIGILGNSFGGPVAVLAAQRDGQIRSMALLAALFNGRPWKDRWDQLMINGPTEEARLELTRILDGQAPGPEFYRGLFTLNLQPALKDLEGIPLLHIHSERDEKIGKDQVEGYQEARKHAKAQTRWVRLHLCNHNFSDSAERNMLVEEVGEWFVATLT